MYKSLPKLLLLSSCSVFSFAAMAGGPEIIQAGWWPYPAGATATALSGEITTGFADGMIPVYGKPTQFFYFDPQGQINNSHQYAVSAGVGGRYLWQNKGIVGAYVFGDYNHSQYNNSFWFVSPGVEFLGDSFDVTGNLYVPVGTQKYTTGSNVFGQDLADPIYDGITFAGNTEYDALYNTSETSGFGGDIDVAYRIPMNKYNPKLHLAGYFSNPEDAEKNRAGGAVRLEFPFSEHLSVLIADSYDNVSYNTVRAGASYSFGGRHTSYNYKNDLESRMVDQIQRNIIANTSDIRNSQPISENTLDTNGSAVYLDNISFFIPDLAADLPVLVGAGGTGTYEDPYVGMSQAQIDDANIKLNTNFFVQSGNYGNPSVGMARLNLTNDNVYGRQSYLGNPFVQQAVENNRPEFYFSNGGFNLIGSSATISSLILSGQNAGGGADIGILYQDLGKQGVTTVLNFNNLDISSFRNPGIRVSSAVGMTSDIVVNIENAYVHHNAGPGISLNTVGVGSDSNTNSLTANIIRSAIVQNGGTGVAMFGDSQGSWTLNMNNVGVTNNTGAGLYAETGEFGGGSGTLSVNMDHVMFGDNVSSNGNAIIKNVSTNDATVNIKDSIFDNNSSGAGAGLKLFDLSSGNLNATITGSHFDYNSNDGMDLTRNSSGDINLNISNSTFLGNATVAMDLSPGGAGGAGDINVVVDNLTMPPMLWEGNLLMDNSAGTGTFTVNFLTNPTSTTFTATPGQTPTISVYCNSAGVCVFS